MKKFVILVAVTQSLLLVGCGGGGRLPNSAVPGAVAGDPYGTGAGYGTGTGTGVSDPYGTGAGYGTGTGMVNDPYGTGAGYGTGTGMVNDPYGTGAGYGAGTGYQDPYGTGAGYGQPGMGTGYGQPGMGQGYVDPVTGQPMVDTGVSQSIMTQLQEAGGISSSKADNIVRDALKATSVQTALGAAPLEHRTMFIKALLDGWAGDEDRTIARQIWNTILPQDQQRLLQQDGELNKLVTKKLLEGGSNGISGIAKEVGKFIGLG